jgi:hypothetical protein
MFKKPVKRLLSRIKLLEKNDIHESLLENTCLFEIYEIEYSLLRNTTQSKIDSLSLLLDRIENLLKKDFKKTNVFEYYQE